MMMEPSNLANNRRKQPSFSMNVNSSYPPPPPAAALDINLHDSEMQLREIDPDIYGLKEQPVTTTAVECPPSTSAAKKICKPGPKSNVLRMLQSHGVKFGSGFRIPFTNDECRALEQKVEELQEQNYNHKLLLRDNKAHNQVMKHHVLNIQEELATTKRLIHATQLEAENTTTLVQLGQRVEYKIGREVGRTNQQIMENCERNCWRQDNIKTAEEKLEAYLKNHQISDDKLEFHKRRMLRNDDVLEKVKYYKALDQGQIRGYEQQYHTLGWEYGNLRRELDITGRNTEKLSELYKRLALDYHKSFKQRRDLIEAWNRSIEYMKSKDEEIREIAELYFADKKTLHELRSKLKNTEQKMLERTDDSGSREKKQLELDRIVQNGRERIEKAQTLIAMLNDELLFQQIEIQQAKAMANNARARILEAAGGEANFAYRITDMENEVAELECKYEADHEDAADKVCKVDYLESLIVDEENRQRELERQSFKLRQLLWERYVDRDKINGYAVKLEDRTHRLRIRIGVIEAKSLTFNKRLSDCQGKDYRLDLDLSTIEVKTIQFLNEALDPRLYTLRQNRIKVKANWDKLSLTMETIKEDLAELKLLEDKIMLEIDSQEKVQFELNATLYARRQEEKRYDKLMATTAKGLTDCLVERNLFRLMLAKAKAKYEEKAGGRMRQVLRRHSLHAVATERREEISDHVEYLTRQRLEYKGRNQRIRIRLANVLIRAERLMGKFQMRVRLMLPSQDQAVKVEESFANKFRRLAREKETLVTESRKWQSKIDEATNEVQGLENAVLIMDVSNNAYRKNLAEAQLGSREYTIYKEELENEKKHTVIKKRYERFHQYLRDKEEYLMTAVIRMQKLSETKLEQAEEKRKEAENAIAHVDYQRGQLSRWNSLLASMIKIVQNKLNDHIRFNYEAELILFVGDLKYQRAVDQMDQFLRSNPAAKDFVYERMDYKRQSIRIASEGRRKGSEQQQQIDSGRVIRFGDSRPTGKKVATETEEEFEGESTTPPNSPEERVCCLSYIQTGMNDRWEPKIEDKACGRDKVTSSSTSPSPYDDCDGSHSRTSSSSSTNSCDSSSSYFMPDMPQPQQRQLSPQSPPC